MLATFHLSKATFTIEFVEMNDCYVVGILSNFGDLVIEVEISELSDIACFVIVDWFG